MGIFLGGEDHEVAGIKRTGFTRYKHVLERDYKELFLVGFITLIFLIPFGAGLAYGVMSQSLIVSVLSGIVGGAIAGPGYACMEDLILRRMRNDVDHWWVCWKRSFRNNAKASILPGIVQCTFISVIAFAAALIFWGVAPVSLGTLLILTVASLLSIMVLSVWWPQVVLFDQKVSAQFKNTIFFCLLHFKPVLLGALVQFLWWMVTVLFMPWTAFLVPILGVWYILLVSINMIYTDIDNEFRVEDQIREQFPGRLEEE